MYTQFPNYSYNNSNMLLPIITYGSLCKQLMLQSLDKLHSYVATLSPNKTNMPKPHQNTQVTT